MGIVKRSISVALCFCLTFSLITVNAEVAAFPEFKKEIYMGQGTVSANTYNYCICYDREGNPEICYTVQGGFFYAFDLMTGNLKFKETLSGAFIACSAMATGSDGKVYFKTYPEHSGGGKLRCYDPYKKVIYYCEGWNVVTPVNAKNMQATEDNKIYVSYYQGENTKNGEVFVYDVAKKTTKNLGHMKEGAQYVQGLAVTEEYIYGGLGTGEDIAAVIRYNPKTGERLKICGTHGGSTFYDVKVISGKIFAVQNSKIVVYDEETLEYYDTIPNTGSSEPSLVSPYDPDIIYNRYKGAIYSYNIKTKEHKRLHDSDLMGLAWAQLPTNEWVLAMKSKFMNVVAYYNPIKDEMHISNVSETAQSCPQIQSIEISSDGIAYMGGYQTSTSAYDTNADEFLFNIQEFHQIEGVGFLNGKTYYGTYTGAMIYRYDPSKPFNYKEDISGNPGLVYDIGNGQDRPFVVKGYGDKLYIGTMCGSGLYGGALTIYREDSDGTPHAEEYRNVIYNQSITGIANKNNKVYLSSTVRSGLGAEITESQAKIAVFDEETKQVVKTVVPDVPVIGTASKTIGEISFGPDGLLWACSELGGTVFAMEPETFEVVKYVQTNPDEDLNPLARPLYIRWGDDGNLYTTAGWNVSVINPATMEYKTLIKGTSLMTLDHNGNIFYVKGKGFNKIPVNQYDRLALFLKTTENLSSETYSAEEWARLKQAIAFAKEIDENDGDDIIISAINRIKSIRDRKGEKESTYNSKVKIIIDKEIVEYSNDKDKPIEFNGRIMLPYKNLFEYFGFEVKWDGKRQKITAVRDSDTIEMNVGEKGYVKNGALFEFDTPPVLLNNCTYIPVRAVADALYYSVSWDEENQSVVMNKSE